MRRFVPTLGCLLLLVASGCGSRLNDERTIQVAPAEEKTLTLDPAARDQKVRVRLESPGAPVNVYCFLEKDQDDVKKALNGRKTSDKVLASQEKKEDADFDFQVPANTRAVVMLTTAGSKSATVKVKLTN